MRRGTLLLAGSAAAAVAAVGAALVSQHVFEMQPCPWCVFQRLIFLAYAALVAVGLAWRTAAGRRITAGIGLLAASGGVAAASYQYFVAAHDESCGRSVAERVIAGLGLDERWPDVFMPMTSCADSTARLLGIAYPLWSLTLFAMLAAATVWVLRQPDW